jgi:D-tyrosyl-tRNA(Tyr) deacylase
MRIVVQRVKYASVTIDGIVKGKINHGLLLLVGIGSEDTREVIEKYVDKVIKLRIFGDENDKINLSVKDVEGEILAISQFTLYADCKKGNRPNFLEAAPPDKAKELYEYFLKACKDKFGKVEAGEFGADMKVELLNDGPFTIILDEKIL